MALQGELEAERQAHAATQARQEERVRQVAILDRQLLELHTQFSADLERTREQVMVAPERASATERRARSWRACSRGRKTPPWPPRRRGRVANKGG